jgi:hypothetical protein
MRLVSLAIIATVISASTSAQPPNLSREAELTAVATADFPYAGFWKAHDCTASYGLAISPGGSPGLYSVSFCGPGGCFEPGTYRPNTTLLDDEKYWVIDRNTIEVGGCGKRAGTFTRYVRCAGREVR